MIAKKTVLLCVGVGASLLAARATAQPQPAPDASKPEASPAAGAAGTDQLILPKGRLLLDAFVEISLSSNAVFKPFSISPDVWYGATPELTVGLVHSAIGSTGFIGNAGDALCLAGKDNGCPDLYPGFGIDGRYKLNLGSIPLAADGGLYVRHLGDPFLLAIKLGAVGRWSSGQIAVEFAPNLFIGLTNRSVSQAVPGGGTIDVTVNGDALNLPVTAFYAVSPMIAVSGQLGFILPLENTGDTYAIPLSIGGHYHVNESLNVTAAFSLPRLLAGSDPQGFDARSFTLGGTYAF